MILKCKRVSALISLIILFILGIFVFAIIGILSPFFPANTVGKIIEFFIIGLFRPLVVVPLILFGYVTFDKINIWLNKLTSFRSPAECLSVIVWGVIGILSVLLILRYRVKITLVLIESSPIFAAYVFGISMSLVVFLLSCFLAKKKVSADFFGYWGRNSLFLMVTHEYLGVRGGIHSVLTRCIKSETVILIFTFISVLLCVYILQLILGRAYTKYILTK